MHKTLLLATGLASLLFHANAQISYENNCLNIGDVGTQSTYELNVGNMSGLNWSYSNDRELCIDMLGIYPQIYSSNNKINFYNTFRNSSNSIIVERIYITELSLNSTEPLENALGSVCILNPVVICQNNGNEERRKNSFSNETINETPELFTKEEDGIVLYKNANLITLLVKSIQELNEEISDNASKLEKLTTKK